MFRKTTLAVPAIALVLCATAVGTAPASARRDPRPLHGPFAEAGWETMTATTVTDAATLTVQEQDGTTHHVPPGERNGDNRRTEVRRLQVFDESDGVRVAVQANDGATATAFLDPPPPTGAAVNLP